MKYLNRIFVLCFGLMVSGWQLAHAQSIELTVYKSPTCGCCKDWIHHIEQQGLVSTAKDLGQQQQLSQIKQQLGLSSAQRSCHTAVSKEGYLFEGHVPAKFIKRFLAAPVAEAKGLAVPAMPLGSPGMEYQNKFQPYKVFLLLNDGSQQVYAEVNHYAEQFE